MTTIGGYCIIVTQCITIIIYIFMRSIINISLPASMVKDVKREVKDKKFGSTSEFFRHLLRQWNTERLAEELKRSRHDFEAGKGKVLRSLADLD